jgi:hypothetical protein
MPVSARHASAAGKTDHEWEQGSAVRLYRIETVLTGRREGFTTTVIAQARVGRVDRRSRLK